MSSEACAPIAHVSWGSEAVPFSWRWSILACSWLQALSEKPQCEIKNYLCIQKTYKSHAIDKEIWLFLWHAEFSKITRIMADNTILLFNIRQSRTRTCVDSKGIDQSLGKELHTISEIFVLIIFCPHKFNLGKVKQLFWLIGKASQLDIWNKPNFFEHLCFYKVKGHLWFSKVCQKRLRSRIYHWGFEFRKAKY